MAHLSVKHIRRNISSWGLQADLRKLYPRKLTFFVNRDFQIFSKAHNLSYKALITVDLYVI